MWHVQFVLFTTKSTKDTKVQINKTPNFVLFVTFVVKNILTLNRGKPRFKPFKALSECGAS